MMTSRNQQRWTKPEKEQLQPPTPVVLNITINNPDTGLVKTPVGEVKVTSQKAKISIEGVEQ